MTIVLGHAAPKLTDQLDLSMAKRQSFQAGTTFDQDWADRRRRCREALARRDHPTWQAVPNEDRHQPVMTPGVGVGPARGIIDLYADRSARRPQSTRPTHRISPYERAVVGGRMDPTQTRRGCAVIRQPVAFGRGSDAHYATLYPGRPLTYSRLRSGRHGSLPQFTLPSLAQRPVRPSISMPRPVIPGVRSLQGLLGANLLTGRFHAPRRVIVATIAVMIVLASAASTGLANQQRYEVQAGDTVDSIAATFGVDPDAIRSSSYLPTGDALEVGQVVIIPEQGQDPPTAAQIAAEREGTSPWVQSAYWIAEGDTLASIGAPYGVAPEVLAEFNDIEDPANLTIGSRVLIPLVAGGEQATTGGGGVANVPDVEVSGVPTYQQTRNLSCEYAAAHIATMTFGGAVSEDVFMASIPQAANPHYGYRGNIDGTWGNTDDYGIYAEALVPTLNEWGFAADAFYGDGSTDTLTANLDAGHPVMVWLGVWGDTRETLTDDGTYSVFAGMHVVTAYGYSDTGIWVSDPASAQYRFYSWDSFLSMWNVVDGMSLAIYPN